MKLFLLSVVAVSAMSVVAGQASGQTQQASPEDLARWRAYHERLATTVATLPSRVSLTEVVAPVLRLAGTRSETGNPVLENRAALVILAIYVNGWPLEAFIPEARAWPTAVRRTALLSDRYDLAQHFILSALISAASGEPIAQAAGVFKEVSDARRGSGFSFSDLAADRAGTLFGQLATRSADSARRLHARMSPGLVEQHIMPSIAGLPDNLPDAEFARRFGGVGQPAYNELVAEIEKRIAALAMMR